MAKTKKVKTKEIVAILNPQQQLFIALYTNPSSPTFGNALQSGLKAGYGKEYSEALTNPRMIPDWLSENIGDMKLLVKAEKAINEALDLPIEEDAIGAFGVIMNKETGKPYRKINTSILKEKGNNARFIAETLGKTKYGKRLELVAPFTKSNLTDYA